MLENLWRITKSCELSCDFEMADFSVMFGKKRHSLQLQEVISDYNPLYNKCAI
jgi:hypothetical protein